MNDLIMEYKNNNDTIAHQQKVALEILHKLECGDPYAILAGGAPRDWYFDKPANDLDFYVYLPEATCHFEELRWKRLGLDVTRLDYEQRHNNKYKMMPDLFRMYEGVLDGVPFQIMVMQKSTFNSVLPYFGTSICKVWWKGHGVRTTVDFLMSVYGKKVYTQEGYLATDYHITKMLKYFPDYELTSYDYLLSDKIRLSQKMSDGLGRKITHSVWAFEIELKKLLNQGE